MTTPATARPVPPDEQRQQLLDAERKAHRDSPRNFKEDALEDKVVSVEPNAPTPTENFDAATDREKGSGSGQP